MSKSIISYLPFEPTEGQQKAASLLEQFVMSQLKGSVFVLKGYAGTGKTTLISAFNSWLDDAQIRTVLMAPTGRAAKVLSLYSKKEAHTIHKKIYYQKNNGGALFFTLQENKHVNTVFIVDEASMIGNSGGIGGSFSSKSRTLLDDIFDYVNQGKNCKLLLIGDEAQLPPVGSDYSPALDVDYLKRAYPINVDSYILTEVTRQALDSGILINATKLRGLLNSNEINQPQFTLGYNDVQVLVGTDIEETLSTVYSREGIDKCVVLCRSNKQANNFNQYIKFRVLGQEEEINAGDLLMVVRNNYYWLEEGNSIGFIANGDMVEITRVISHEELFGFRFADVSIRMIDYPDAPEVELKILLDTLHSETPSLSKEEGNKLYEAVMESHSEIKDQRKRMKALKADPYFNALQVKFGYAITCHKSQGGQWETVFVDQGYLTEEMIDVAYVRWLYTAITRAKTQLYLTNFNEKFFSY